MAILDCPVSHRPRLSMARKLPPFPPLNAVLAPQDQKLPLVSGPVPCRPLQDGTTQARPSWGDQDGVLLGPTCFLNPGC